MPPTFLKSSYSTNTSSVTNLSFLELVQEMKLLGMDPKSILEIAANDLFSRHGSKVIAYIKMMLDQMITENNPNGIYLWNELYNILSSRFSTSYITIH